MYATDRGIEELAERLGGEQLSYGALADRLRDFVDIHPEHENVIERLACWLARDDGDGE